MRNSRRAVLGASGGLAFLAALRPLRIFAQASGGKLRIGIIGSGHIGGAIGGLWVKAGHPVLFSSRHPEELKDLVAGLGPLAQNGTVSQAVAFGDALQRKIVLDACNAVPARDGAIADEVEREGVGITSQKYLPATHLVRAFNTLAYTIFVREANRPDPKLAIPIAGDDGEALAIAAGLVRDAGFEPVVVGKLVDARRFQRGAPGYGQSVTAAELRQKLSLTP